MTKLNKLPKDATSKEKVIFWVEQYKRTFPTEYQAVVADVKAHQLKLENKLGAIQGDHVLEQEVVRWPEVLFENLKDALTADDWLWLFGDKKRGIKHQLKWFTDEYPEFKVPEKF